MGLKESGLRGSLRNVSVGIDAIPDSGLDHFWWGPSIENISIWPDGEGDEDLSHEGEQNSIFGDINGTQAVDYPGDSYHEGDTALSFGSDNVYTGVAVFQLADNNDVQTVISFGNTQTGGDGSRFQVGFDNDGYRVAHAGVENSTFVGNADTDPHVAVFTYDGSNIILDIDGEGLLNESLDSPNPPSEPTRIGNDFADFEAEGLIAAGGFESDVADSNRRDELTELLADPFDIPVST